ncbi:MAG: helix-turn-helix transcriptional regulator [Anaeromyxobacter sp.]
MPPAPLGEFETLVLLAVLRLRDGAYGMAVRRELEARAGREAAIGAVYATLERLEAKGLVASRTGEATEARGGRARRYFEVTRAGRAAVAAAAGALARMIEGLKLDPA